MGPFVYKVSLAAVIVVALGRVAGILTLKIRQARYTRRAVAAPRSWRDECTVPEPYLLGVATLVLAFGHQLPSELSAGDLARASAGGLLAAFAAVLMLWALKAFPSVSTGHYVLPEHRVVSDGPYGLVRHPLYAAAFLIWFGLAIAFSSLAAALIAVCDVIPGYLVYMRAEEEMLLAQLGDPYRAYRQRVGMLFPRAARRR